MHLIKNFLHSQETDESRGKRRIKRVALTGVSSLLAKGVTTVSALVTIPLTAQYLGTERFGMWLTISTFLAWGGAIDLGLGNSLLNALATADARADRKQAKETVTTALYLMFFIAGIVIVLFVVAYPLVTWQKVLNVKSSQAIADTGAAIVVSMIIFALRVPASISTQIYAAYQEGYLAQVWGTLSSLLSLITLLVAIYLHASLALLIASFFLPPLLIELLAAIHHFGWRRRWLQPSLDCFSWFKAKFLLKSGFQLWVAQISAIILMQTDLIIVAQMFGSSAVASYGVTLKLFAFVGMLQYVFVTALWPAYSEALARNDIFWIEQIFRKSIYMSLLWSISVGVLLFLYFPHIISHWVSSEAVPERSLVLAIYLTTIFVVVHNCVCMLINGMGCLRLQAFISPFTAICNLLLSIGLAHRVGISGVAWATGICTLLSLTVLNIHVMKQFRKLRIHNL
jgi:O-antigen/teichoic acid export membrane protein